MDIGQAMQELENGNRVARVGWNGKGMWLDKVKAHWSGELVSGENMPDEWQGNLPFVVMFTADQKLIPWSASQSDLQAKDWQVVGLD